MRSGFFAKGIDADALAFLESLDAVELVEQDQLVRAVDVQANPTWGIDRIDGSRNGEYRYARFRRLCCCLILVLSRFATRCTLSYLFYTHTHQALFGSLWTELFASYIRSSAGEDVNVYVIDSGVRIQHSDFEGRATHIWSDYADPDDCNGHGTHVAGTVGGMRYGVAKKARIFGLKALDCNGVGTTSAVAAAISAAANHAQGHSKTSIINLSLGGGISLALDAQINSLPSNVLAVVAAGNDNADACFSSPARAAGAFTVMATDSNDRMASFSNFGECAQIFAPGVSISSAYPCSDAACSPERRQCNDCTAVLSGTSMAAPHVAGTAAILVSESPSMTKDDVCRIF